MKKNKELEDLFEKLKESLEGLKGEIRKRVPPPNFEIHLKAHPDGEGYMSTIKGNKPSLMLALAELVVTLVKNTNLSKHDIVNAVEHGLDRSEEDDDEEEEED